MAWQADRIPLEYAHCRKLVSVIRSRVNDFNTAMEEADEELAMQSLILAGGPLLTSHVRQGKLTADWNPRADSPKGGMVRIRVSGSGEMGMMQVVESKRAGIDLTEMQAFRNESTMRVYVYFHPDAFRIDKDPDLQEELREAAMLITLGWMRHVLQEAERERPEGGQPGFVLESQEYHPTDGTRFDTLGNAFGKTGYAGPLQWSFGNGDIGCGVCFVHSGSIA